MTIARITIWVFRGIATLYAALLMTQPVWIGLFLQGQFDQLAVHRAVGGASIAATWLLILAAIGLGWFARLSWWPALVGVLLFWALTGQFVLGQSRLTALHIPLGVLIIVMAGALAFWSWLPIARHLADARPPREGRNRVRQAARRRVAGEATRRPEGPVELVEVAR